MGLGCKKHAMQGCMSGEDTNSHSGLGAGSGSGAEPMEVDQGAPLSRNERPIGAARALPKAAEGNGEESKYGTLTMSGHVPTTREIESGAVVVEEVQAVKDTDSVLTADLQPLDRPEEQFQFVLDNMTTRKWEDRFDTLHYLRSIVKFGPESLEPHLPAIDKCLVDSLKNPRSSVIRESLQLAQDLLSCAPLKAFIKERFIWAKLVPAVLLKSINDKKFLAEQGILALDAFSSCYSEHYRVFLAEADNRNAKVAALAFATVSKCITSLGKEGLERMEPAKPGSPPLEPLVTASVKALLKGKLAALRDSGKECLEKVIQATGGFQTFEATYGPKIGHKDMVQLLTLLPHEGGEPKPPARPATASSFAAKRPVAAVSGRGAGFGMLAEEDDEEVTIKPKLIKKKDASGGLDMEAKGEADDAIGRLRRNSATPRSRKSADDVMLEF